MRKLMVLSIVSMLLGATAGCDSSDDKGTPNDVVAADTQTSEDVDTTTTPDTAADLPGDTSVDVALPTCPDETELAESLPCDCYGTKVTDPAVQVPGCATTVVCCPAAQGLKCEDYEHLDVTTDVPEDTTADVVEDTATPDTTDTSVEDAADAIEDLANVGNCPYEVALDTHTPCMCKGTLVTDVHETLPDCTKKVVCCPISGPKCE